MADNKKIIIVEVVPWDGEFGLSIRYSNGDAHAYHVGSEEDARAEMRRLSARDRIRVVK